MGPESLMVILVFLLAGALEVDRLWGAEAATQAQQLQNGFTGRFEDAQCSCPADGERIRRELADSGSEKALEQAVSVLIRMGMSTRHLRQAEERAGALGNASAWSVFKTFFIDLSMCMVPLSIVRTIPPEQPTWPYWLASLEGVLYAIIFACVPPDRKAFAANSLSSFTICAFLLSVMEGMFLNPAC